MKFLSLTAAAAALLLAPTTAHAQLFGGFDNSSVLGGLAGAGIGGAIGSNLAGSGNRDEGTAIGAALGGLAGVAYGNRNSRYGGNPYAGSFNPGFSGNSLLGTALGAGIGGAIGSNLAGSGVRQEGTAIGAVLGGLAGNAISSRSRYGNQGFGGNSFSGGGFGGTSRYGSNAPVMGGFGAPAFGGGFAPASYGPGFGAPGFGAPSFGPAPFVPGPFIPAPQFGATLPPFPTGGTSFVPGGFVNAGTFATAVPAPQPTFRPAPMPVYQPLSTAFSGVTYAAPNVSLAGPSLRSTTYGNSNRYGDSIGSTTTQNYSGSTRINAPLILRGPSAPRSQMVVIERDHYSPRVSNVSSHSHTSGYTSAGQSYGGEHNHGGIMAPRGSSAPVSSGQSIHAETVNINYGNNSQVGTTSSNNGSTVGAGHSHSGQVSQSSYTAPTYSAPTYSAPSSSYTAPSGPIDFGDGIGDGTWGSNGGSVNTGSYSVGSTSVLGGYQGYSNAAPVYTSSSSRYSSGETYAPTVTPSSSAGEGGQYMITSGQSYQAPSAAEFAANCAAGSAGCGSSNGSSYDWNTASPAPAYGTSYGSQSSSYGHGTDTGSYSYCGSNKTYNKDGGLVLGGSPVCR